MLFLMISTKASQRYTSLAINSLLRSTFFRKKDRLLVIDNDGDLDISDVCGWDLIKNEAPRGFAENANCGLRLARKLKTDLILLNNDIIFTKHWLEFMNPKSDRISVPYCNQDVQYSQGGFSLHFAMNLADYDENNDSNLEIIAERHRRLCETSRFNNVIFSLIPFFCAHIPYEV